MLLWDNFESFHETFQNSWQVNSHIKLIQLQFLWNQWNQVMLIKSFEVKGKSFSHKLCLKPFMSLNDCKCLTFVLCNQWIEITIENSSIIYLPSPIECQWKLMPMQFCSNTKDRTLSSMLYSFNFDNKSLSCSVPDNMKMYFLCIFL